VTPLLPLVLPHSLFPTPPVIGGGANGASWRVAPLSLVMASLPIALLTVSDRRSLAQDASGTLLEQRIHQAGHRLVDRCLIPDDRYRIRAVVSGWIADPQVAVVLTTGGTGLTGRDDTPEAIAPLLDKTITGFGELFRMLSFDSIGASSLQSRSLAGVANAAVA